MIGNKKVCLILAVIMIVSLAVVPQAGVNAADLSINTTMPSIAIYSGYIKPDVTSSGTDIKSGFKVEVDGTNISTLTDANGYFSFNRLSPSLTENYTFKISKPGYLTRNVISSAYILTISSQSSPVLIWAGDLPSSGIQDGVINMGDIMEIAKAFNTVSTDARYNAVCDFNMDNSINMGDILIAAGHFNSTSSSYPALIQVSPTPPSSTSTSTSTSTPTLTSIPTAIPTSSVEPTETPTAISTATSTATPTATAIPISSPTSTLTPTPTYTPTITPTAKPSISPTMSEDEKALLDLVNMARADANLGQLQYDFELANVAMLKAQDMVDNDYFDHISPTYGSPFDMMDKFGIKYLYAGENIAGGFSSADSVFTGWMNSSGHRANILDSNYTHCGFGIANGGTYGKIWVQMFIGK